MGTVRRGVGGCLECLWLHYAVISSKKPRRTNSGFGYGVEEGSSAMVGRAAKTIAFLCHFMYTCWENIATLSIDHRFEYNDIAYEENNAPRSRLGLQKY